MSSSKDFGRRSVMKKLNGWVGLSKLSVCS